MRTRTRRPQSPESARAREIVWLRSGPRQRVAYSASDEVAQLLFDAMSSLCVCRHGHGLGADVIADTCFDCMGGIQLKNCLHLIRRKRGQVGISSLASSMMVSM